MASVHGTVKDGNSSKTGVGGGGGVRWNFTFCLLNNSVKRDICSLTHVPVYYCNRQDRLQKQYKIKDKLN